MDKENKYEWGEGVFTLLSWFKKDKVKNARVLVAGAGALGNEVVKNLALFGVGTIFVVDFDRIEISNLTRSILFREEDAYNHSFKAEVIAKRAMEINPQIKVIPIVGRLDSEVGFGIYRSVDVVIGCLDSRIARYQLNRMCMRAGKSWIDGGIENLTGSVKVFTPELNCYECQLSREDFSLIMVRMGCADVVRIQSEAGRVATTPISASIVGAIQVQEALKIIHGDTDGSPQFKTLQGKMLHYEGLTNSTNIYRMASWKSNCPSHERWEPVIECEELSAQQTVGVVLKKLKTILDVSKVEINMCNNKFVDKIISINPEKEFEIQKPESKLEEVLRTDPDIKKLSHFTTFHKVFYENIDEGFPYQELTLQQIGIPLFDVLKVSTENGPYYVELDRDASQFV